MNIKHRHHMDGPLGELLPGDVYIANQATYMVTAERAVSGRVLSINLASGTHIDRPATFMVTACPEAVLLTNQLDPTDTED